jgi:MFS family permease
MYTVALAICSLFTFVLTLRSRVNTSSSAGATPTFKKFQLFYLTVYYVAMTADWLQGPYVYALYSKYGLSPRDIAVLFVAGFGSSMLFGTFVGAAADKLGRKRMCQLYCIAYFLSCVTKHANDYWWLMVGRILGGIATSLLFSSFESWMVCE